MLSDNDLELLSAYLDGALTPGERAALETRLSTDADLRRELARLRATVDLVKGLPTLAAPRDFTLTPRMVRRSPTILTSAAFSALSAAAAVVLLLVGAALFTNSVRLPANNFASNQVVFVPTTTFSEIQDGLQTGVDESAEVARQQEDTAAVQGTLADITPFIMLSTQQAQGFSSEIQPVEPTGSLEPLMYAAAPESATLEEERDDFADTTASGAAAANQQTTQDGEGQLALEQTAPTDLSQASEPSQPPASESGGAASDAAQPVPGESAPPPMAGVITRATPSPAPTLAPTETPTPKPTETPTATHTSTALPTSTSTPSLTPTLIPSSTPPPPTATPQPAIFDASGSAGIGIGLIVVALFLLGTALVTTILRRRA